MLCACVSSLCPHTKPGDHSSTNPVITNTLSRNWTTSQTLSGPVPDQCCVTTASAAFTFISPNSGRKSEKHGEHINHAAQSSPIVSSQQQRVHTSLFLLFCPPHLHINHQLSSKSHQQSEYSSVTDRLKIQTSATRSPAYSWLLTESPEGPQVCSTPCHSHRRPLNKENTLIWNSLKPNSYCIKVTQETFKLGRFYFQIKICPFLIRCQEQAPVKSEQVPRCDSSPLPFDTARCMPPILLLQVSFVAVFCFIILQLVQVRTAGRPV